MKSQTIEKPRSTHIQNTDDNYIKIPKPSIRAFSNSRYTPLYVILLIIMTFLGSASVVAANAAECANEQRHANCWCCAILAD